MSTHYKVNGTMLHSVDASALERDALNADLTTATRRRVEESRRRGITLTEREARDEVIAEFDAGAHHLLPQYTRISTRRRQGKI